MRPDPKTTTPVLDTPVTDIPVRGVPEAYGPAGFPYGVVHCGNGVIELDLPTAGYRSDEDR